MTLPEVMAGEVAHKGKSRRTRGRVSPGESPKRGVAYKDACPYLYTPPPPPLFCPGRIAHYPPPWVRQGCALPGKEEAS